jgi:copper transport protein
LRTADPAANAFLQRPPGQVTLSFTEPIDAKSSSIEILDAAGQPVATGEVDVSDANMTVALPVLKPGIYNVLWANVSRIDGHAIRGSYPFTVLNGDGSLPDQTNSVGGLTSDPDPPPLADGVAVRALSLLGLLLVAGGAVLALLWPAPEPRVRRGLVLTVYAGSAVLLAATALNFVTIHDAYSGLGTKDLVFNTPSGGYWLTRIGLVFLIAVANTFAFEAPRRTAAALAGCVVLYLWAFTATSHAAAGNGSSWAKAFDIMHGVAAVAWIGAVIGLAVAARLARESDWRVVVPRFSLLASSAVFILLATGVLNSFVEIEKVSRLWETRYGVILLVKLTLMFPLLALAAYNAKWGKHRLDAGTPAGRRRFVVFASGEAFLGLAVFLAAAFLTQTTVSKSIVDAPDAKPFDQQITMGDLGIRLAIDPNQTGLNTYRVALTDASDAPVEAQRVRLTFRYQENQGIGASTLPLAAGGERGAYIGQGPFMTLEGRWRVEVEVRRESAADTVGFFDVRPAGTAVVNTVSGGAWDNPAPGLTWNQFGGLVFLVAGLGFALARTPLRQAGKEAGWAANGMTMMGFAFGVLLLFGVHGHEALPGEPTNPIYPDANSISQGRTLFEQNCATCHGRTGVPPKGLDLNPYPLDLTVHVPQHTDGQLFRFINDGVAGSAMRAWGSGDGALTEEQIWHLVNFLRTFTPVDK